MEDYIRARPDVFFTGAGRQPALQPRLLPGRRPLRLRHVHRLDAADRPRRQQLDRDARPHRRLRRRARTWAPTRAGRRHASPAWLKAGREARAGRGADRRAARSWWCRWSRPSASTCSRPSSSGSTPGRWQEQAGMELPPVMIYGDDVTPHPHRGRHRQPAAVPQRRGARAGDPRRRRLHRRSGSGATGAWSRTCATAA